MSHAATEAVSVLWMQRLMALAVMLQTIELLQVRSAFSDSGVWSLSVLQSEQRQLAWPLRAGLGWLSRYRPFVGVLVVRLALAPLLALGAAWAAFPLLLSQLVIAARFRGTFNGGSDYMTVVVLLGLTLAAAGAERAGMAYVCVQLVLSYVIAGAVKLAQRDWRSGVALTRLLTTNRYGRSLPWASRGIWARLGAWSVLLFECGFPAALLVPSVSAPLLVIGLMFHVTNAYLFGLNRFVFAWLAAYPALLYFSGQLAGPW